MASSRSRSRRRSSSRGRSSVFMPGAMRYNPRASQASAASSMRGPMSETASMSSALGPDMASALAPQVEAFAPPGPIFDELPPVDVEPSGGFNPPGPEDTGSSQLVDAIMQEEEPLAAAPTFEASAAPSLEPPSLYGGAGGGSGAVPGPIMPSQGFIQRYLAAQDAGRAQPKTLVPPPPSLVDALNGIRRPNRAERY